MDSNNALATGDSCRCAHHIMLTADLGGRRVSLTTRMLSRIPNVCNHGCAKTLLQRRVATCIERADGRRLNHGVQQGAFTGGHFAVSNLRTVVHFDENDLSLRRYAKACLEGMNELHAQFTQFNVSYMHAPRP